MAASDFATRFALCSAETAVAVLADIAVAPEETLSALAAAHGVVVAAASTTGGRADADADAGGAGRRPARSAFRPIIEAAIDYTGGIVAASAAAAAGGAVAPPPASVVGLLRVAVASRDIEALGIGLAWAFQDAHAQVPPDVAQLATRWLAAFEAAAPSHCLAWVAMHSCAAPEECARRPMRRKFRKWICASCGTLNDMTWSACTECADPMAMTDSVGRPVGRPVRCARATHSLVCACACVLVCERKCVYVRTCAVRSCLCACAF